MYCDCLMQTEGVVFEFKVHAWIISVQYKRNANMRAPGAKVAGLDYVYTCQRRDQIVFGV